MGNAFQRPLAKAGKVKSVTIHKPEDRIVKCEMRLMRVTSRHLQACCRYHCRRLFPCITGNSKTLNSLFPVFFDIFPHLDDQKTISSHEKAGKGQTDKMKGEKMMKKHIKTCLALIAASSMMMAVNVSAQEDAKEDSAFPFTLVTKNEEEVTFDHVPERVLSTNPNTGEQLMALGLGDKIIATCYNNAQVSEEYRTEYESKPVIAEKYPSLEVVLDLNPDFIYGRSSAFGDSDSNIATHTELQTYGIMSLSSIEGYKLGCDLEDVYQDFYNLGEIFQVQDRAEEIVSKMKEKVAAVEEKVKVHYDDPVRVFNFDSDRDGGAYTPGNNFTSKLIRHAGGVNIFEDLEKTWNTVSWEEVVARDPEIIVINDYGDTTAEEKVEFLKNNEALSDVTAIKEERFIIITLPEVFASTRVADTVEKFAEGFYPELFE